MKHTIRIEISATPSAGKASVAQHLESEIIAIGNNLGVIIDVIHEEGVLSRYDSGLFLGVFTDAKSAKFKIKEG